MKTTEILEKYESGEFTMETVFDELANIGFSPNLLNDDNGFWAVVFDGMQTTNFEDEPIDIVTTFFVNKEEWKISPKEALVYTLKQMSVQ